MTWAEINGVALRYDVVGEGSLALLLIHEMGGSLNSWDRLAPLLAKRHRVVRFDLRGQGMSEKTRGEIELTTLISDAAALMDHLDIRSPVVPIGCAVGGAVALAFAAEQATRCAGVVALAPSTSVPIERRPALLERASQLEKYGARYQLDDSLMRSYPPIVRGDAAVFETTRAARIAADPFGVAALIRMLAYLDMRALFERINCPALILAGMHDQDRPPNHVEGVAAKIKSSQYKAIDSAHFMATQSPQLVAAEMLSFLEAL